MSSPFGKKDSKEPQSIADGIVANERLQKQRLEIAERRISTLETRNRQLVQAIKEGAAVLDCLETFYKKHSAWKTVGASKALALLKEMGKE